MPSLSRYAVYTTIAVERLETASHGDGASEPLSERRRWVSAKALLDEADAGGEDVPIVFSDSRDCSALVRWAVLREIRIGPDVITTFRFARLAPMRGHSPQELVLRSSGKHIAPGFIRPYAICRTPPFLIDPGVANARSKIEQEESFQGATNDGECCCQCGKPRPSKNRPVCVTCERKGVRAVFCGYGNSQCFQAHFVSHVGRRSFRVKTENIEDAGPSSSMGTAKRDMLGGLIYLDADTDAKQRESVRTASVSAARAEATAEALVEGAMARVEGNVYERNPKARRRCIEHYGAICAIVGLTLNGPMGGSRRDSSMSTTFARCPQLARNMRSIP
jgi:hypothetical protein